jgi:hypothetical protein
MDWRCEWCGKPHEEDNPPCDNCGHGSFERAVVPVAGGDVGSKAAVWVCTECGREHTKHSPPCSRCGNHSLERQVQEFDDAETAVPGYLDLLTPRFAAGIAVVLVLAGVFTLGVTGLVDLPGFGTAVPEVSAVPGNATAASDVRLADVEHSYLATLDDERQAAGRDTVTREATLDEIATFYNQRRVKATVGAGSLPPRDQMRSLLEGPCDGEIVLISSPPPQTSIGAAGSAASLGGELADSVLDRGELADVGGTRTGVDVHAGPDGTVYLTQFVC